MYFSFIHFHFILVKCLKFNHLFLESNVDYLCPNLNTIISQRYKKCYCRNEFFDMSSLYLNYESNII